MVSEVFSVYDSKAEVYSKPFLMKKPGEAMRLFVNVVNDPQTEMNKHPEDFTLFHLGTFDDEKGTFENKKTPTSMAVGIEVKKPDMQLKIPAIQ